MLPAIRVIPGEAPGVERLTPAGSHPQQHIPITAIIYHPVADLPSGRWRD